MKKIKTLVTGGTGFVGTHLVPLLKDKREVLIYTGEIRDKERVLSVVRDFSPEEIYHLAAQPFVPKAIEDPWETESINVGGTLNILEAVHRNRKATRMVYVSSADVYGKQSESSLPFKEDLIPEPLNPYSGSKLAAESYCRQYSYYSEYTKVIIARPFNHIGIGQRPEFVIPNFCLQIVQSVREKKNEIFVGDLNPTRDFSNVKDIVSAYVLLMEKGVPGQIYNICSGNEVSIQFIVEELIKISGSSLKWQTDPSRVRKVETSRLIGNNSKIKELGWKPKFGLSETLKEIYQSISESNP